ncbi:MAG TPA: hypothetical protein VKP02_04165 [Gemmatimonadaceae bacterium]|nr:hypothetical protein [Gemmatimonadaceae bacterium]
MNRLMIAVLACITVAACSDSLAPTTPDVGGQWLYRVQGLSDGGQVRCSMTIEDTLFLGKSASKVAGRYSGGTIICGGADAESINLVTGSVVNGTLDPMVKGSQDVAFDLDGSSWHQAGVLIGDRMSGTLSVDHVFAGKLGHLVLTGTWTAQRTSISAHKPPPN